MTALIIAAMLPLYPADPPLHEAGADRAPVCVLLCGPHEVKK